jgi:hypothetical protein
LNTSYAEHLPRSWWVSPLPVSAQSPRRH